MTGRFVSRFTISVTGVRRYRPTVVAFVGIGSYRFVTGTKDARVGLQKELFGGQHAWVLPNPSGLNAHYQAAELGRLFRELRLWATVKHKRKQKAIRRKHCERR